MDRPQSDALPYFFLSYAHLEADDALVEAFYRKLTHDIRLQSGVRTAMGFCDASLRAGVLWSTELVEHLSTAQVFIPLMSRAYFGSPECGKEWAVFDGRPAEDGQGTAVRPPILPLFWTPMKQPPDFLRQYQWRDQEFGDVYAARGLRDLIRMERLSDHYHEFVQAVAIRVVELNETIRVEAASRPAFHEVVPAFPAPASIAISVSVTTPAPVPVPPPRTAPPEIVRPTPRAQPQVSPRPGPPPSMTVQVVAETPVPRKADSAGGRVITFYSYQGGTGRTMALANVAWLLASSGYKVLTIDWDLESPSLHSYFRPFLRDKNLRDSDGILDVVRRYADEALNPESRPPDMRRMARVENFTVALDWEFANGGGLDFVPAGRQNADYVHAVSTFDWDDFWQRANGSAFFDALRDDVTANYDFALVDSRSGLSDTAGICTIQLPDTVLSYLTMNAHSIDGAEATARSILAQNPSITVLPVASRIEGGDPARLARGRAYVRRRFEPFLKLPAGGNADTYWDSMEIPYVPFYAFDETLAVFGDPEPSDGSLLSSYMRMASRIAGHDCPAPAVAATDRARVLAAFDRSMPADPRTVLIAYAPLDRIWAEWLYDQLSDRAHQVVLRNVLEPSTDLDGVDRLIILYSRDFVAHEPAHRLLQAARDRATAGDQHYAIALRVDGTPLENRLSSRAVIDALGVSEDRLSERLLGALNIDLHDRTDRSAPTIRFPAELAPHWNVQLTRNPRFSGRGHILEAIRDQLQSSRPDNGPLVLIGLPGVGKTQIALEYVYRFAAAYDLVCWISATQPARVRVALADLADRLQLPGASVEEHVEAVLQALQRGVPTRRWLVVLDNAEEPGDLADLLPAGPGHVLLTSRNPQWSGRLRTLDVDVFDRAESVELLRRRVPAIGSGDARQLAARLGDLPLAIEQAAGWLSSTGMTAADYLTLLESSVAGTAESAPVDYDRTIASTVQVAVEQLNERSPAAVRLLELFAFLAPEAIPFRLISNRELTAVLAPLDARMEDPTRHGTLIREIGRMGLARTATGENGMGLVVHRLTQGIVRARLSDAEQAERRAEVQRVLGGVNLGSPEDPANWSSYESLRPHLEASEAPGSTQPGIRQILLDLARYLWLRGDPSRCVEFGNAVLGQWRARSGDDDVDALRLMHPISLAMRDLGDEDAAYRMSRDAYRRLDSLAGRDDPYTLVAAGALASALRGQGDYATAQDLDEQASAALRDALGDDDRLTMTAVLGFIASLRLTGESAMAMRLSRGLYERSRRVFGHRDLTTIGAQVSHGVDLREKGLLTESADVLLEAYETLVKEFGADRLWTQRGAHAYAVTLRRLGRYEQADKLIDEAALRSEAVLGRRNRVTLDCRLEQACLRWAVARPEEARHTAEEIFTDCVDTLGHTDLLTLCTGNHLAIFRRTVGDLSGAVNLATEISQRLETAFGPAHPYALAGLVTLANVRWARGERTVARGLDETVYTRTRRTLPTSHPIALSAAVNFAVSRRSMGPKPAERIHAEALEGLIEMLGATHPGVASARDWQRMDVDATPLPM